MQTETSQIAPANYFNKALANRLFFPNNCTTFAPHFTNLDNFLAASMQAGRRENSFSFRV